MVDGVWVHLPFGPLRDNQGRAFSGYGISSEGSVGQREKDSMLLEGRP